MVLRFPRLARFALPVLAAFSLLAPAGAQTPAPVARADATPWLYRGSDIPPDPAWVFGELSNGLKYAVRRNGVPPRQVSIRVAIDAGSLMESPTERGFAHFNEHLSFRGSRYVPDGEAKRVFQRLGATFGSDTNAQTTPTQTIYKLDLPAATPESLDESVKILSGMMAAPIIAPASVDAERRTVLAELREGTSPQQRIADATRELFFAGQKLGQGSPIGDIPSLQAATPEGLRAFHDRWYRPERALVVIVGDADPATLQALVVKYFSDWKGVGPAPADPDFGKPKVDVPRAKVIVEPGLPALVSFAVLRPWLPKADTIEYNRGKLVQTIAARLINRRLETRARSGGSYLQASIDTDDVSRSVNGTFIQIVPIDGRWDAAVRDVRAVIADALNRPSSPAEIQREANEFAAALQVGVETERTQAGGELADTLVEAVNIRETVASATVARDVFSKMGNRLTPASILAATQAIMAGTPTRALLTTPAAEPGAEAKLLAALTSPVKASIVAAVKPISFDKLPRLGKPATVVKRTPLGSLGIEVVALSNGVNLVLFPNQAETGKVIVSVRFGRGLQALPTDRRTDAWAGDAALIAGGIAGFGQDALDRLTSGRQINMNFDIAEDAFVIRSQTRASDLADQLRLTATKLAFPGWDPAPVLRARAGALTGYDGALASPGGVLGRELGGLLHGNDPRFTTPDRAQITALTPASFRALWEPILKTGPVEVSIYGDFDAAKAIDAALGTFGALPPRPAAIVPAAALASPPPVAAPTPIARTHKGPADQAAAVLAWPTGGGLADIYESRKLDILAAIFNDRLFEQFREGEGASYSPNVASQWPNGLASGGSFVVTSQLKPEGVANFYALTRKIAAQFVSTPVSSDELARSLGPMRQLIARASSGNAFWLQQLGGVSTDPRKLGALATLASDYARITPEELQATAKRYLVPTKEFAMVVLPEKASP